MARIIVTGYMIRLPFMGNMLAFAQHVVGLRRLGHEVIYLEESGWPGSCYNPNTNENSDDPTYGMQAAEHLFSQLGASDQPILFVNRDSGLTYGSTQDSLDAWIDEADLLLNIGGVCWLPQFQHCRCRALIDMDPMFTQAGKFGQEGLDLYDTLFTYGTNINGSDCGVPNLGRTWHPTVPPVLLDLWDPACTPQSEDAGLSTIATWSAYGSTEYKGEKYGQKDVEFDRLIELPRQVHCALDIRASGISEADAQRFREAGWTITPPDTINYAFNRYREFIVGSLGEFSVAKHGYIKSRCGWISDRTVCYLAAGRPAVIADTGDAKFNQSSSGVLTFQNQKQAATHINNLLEHYSEHSEAARKIAAERFSHEVVLSELIEIACSRAPQRIS